ncbi:CUB and sushi domain-containing protein 1 [Galendromus occidentalis]|uniref:CUB and sushi domain-containing protein 1 n=1 Tax=Galendromus occidentalis TaxID=34638 RepID=A0AAJ7SF88_9ACAR|nr:CUB and sushi domain-containing protein 1 [Galendromus occidentalis]
MSPEKPIAISKPAIRNHPCIPASSCPPPAVPLYSTVKVENGAATYTCDTGYELFGSGTRKCHDNKWEGKLPYCATNVALNKPSTQSSVSTKNPAGPKLANDGDMSTVGEKPVCTETKVENSPWWQVDLLQTYEVRVVKILTRGCCGHQPLHDIEIRVSNSSSLTGSRLCAWFPGTLEDGAMKEFACAYPIVGRYVSVQMVGGDGSLSLCEVQVFSTQELSVGMCGHFDDVVSILRNCYEFHLQGGSRRNAEEHCEKRGGLLAYNVDRRTLPFIGSELTRRNNNNQLNQGLVWIGATLKRGIGPGRRGWFWSNGENIASSQLLWGEGQPNNYNKQQNCIVLDQKLSWMFNDFNCDLDYLPWICQYEPVRCGSPDVSENSTLVGKDFGVLRTVKYGCPVGSVIQGDAERTCQKTGFWSGTAPTCKHVDCGSLRHIANGKAVLRDLRTTFNATAVYICDTNYTLVGEEARRCAKTGFWTGQEPKCQLNFCGTLTPPVNGSIQLEGVKAGKDAVYSCNRGHALIGVARRKCMLGGQWTATAPTCRYVDCGKPSPPENGNINFVNNTWDYQSIVTYSCNNDYTLVNGDVTRTCNERGVWSGREPECRIIACSPPPIPNGAYIKADGSQLVNVHSSVEYGCLSGYKLMSGDLSRTCLKSGLWSGTLLHCQLVDCGRVPPILKGEVKYMNDTTTTLDSVIKHSCINGYRLVGSETRVCGADGRWTGVSPKCEEIRCEPPDVAPNTTVLYSNNDRSSIDSFKVGSSVMYKCMAGHIIEGVALRNCLPSGQWDGTDPPTCHYVDCGAPPSIQNGEFHAPTTHYGALVEYRCHNGYRLSNGAERRLCLENGTWSGSDPACVEVLCPEPPQTDSRLLVEVSSYNAGSVASYSCQEGYQIVGEFTRVCRPNGRWEPPIIPTCSVIDCGRPDLIPNGRGLLVNGSTTYNSHVEYECLHEKISIGETLRVCLANGTWSGREPLCVDGGSDQANDVDNLRLIPQYDEQTSSSIGISLAIGGLLLISVLIGAAWIWMKHKPSPPVNIHARARYVGKNHISSPKNNYQSTTQRPPFDAASMAEYANVTPPPLPPNHPSSQFVTFNTPPIALQQQNLYNDNMYDNSGDSSQPIYANIQEVQEQTHHV